MEILIDAFQYGFFVRAFAVGLALAVVYALLGNFVVLREEVVIGHTIANVVFLGVALSLLFSWSQPWVMVASAILGVFFILYLKKNSRFSQNSILEMTAQIAIASGIVVLAQLTGYRNITGFLFGNILAISNSDVWLTLTIFLFNMTVLFLIRRPLTQMVINRDLAIAAGNKVERINFIFLVLLALTVAAGIKIIGVVLLGAFLVIPANIAKNLAKSFRQMVGFSVGISLLAVMAGLFFSYLFDTPSGAMIVLILGVILVVTNLFRKVV